MKLCGFEVGLERPLFLIAGGPGMSHAGMHSFDGLSDSSMLVFIDNFGRGKSDRATSSAEYSIDNDVSDVEGIRKALGFEKINILGHSYGSAAAQLYAIKYGENVDHLIVANGFYNCEMWQDNNDSWNFIFSHQFPELWDSLMVLRSKGFRSSDPAHDELYNQFPMDMVQSYCPTNNFKHRKSCESTFNNEVYYQIAGPDADFYVSGDISKFDVTGDLSKLEMPMLIIAGRYDRALNPKYSLEYKKFCPRAKFVMFEYSGHNPQIEESQLEFKLINSFLKNFISRQVY